MKTLPQEKVWTGSGRGAANAALYKQFKRNEHAAIYEMWLRNGTFFNGYEVFKVKVQLAGSPLPGGGKVEESYERWPGDDAFGRWAWHFKHQGMALKRFDELTNNAIGVPNDDDVEVGSETSQAAGKRGRGRPKVDRPTLTIPVKEFTVGELAEENHVDYPVAFLFVKDEMTKGTIVFKREERRNTRGKASKIYAKA